MTERTPYAELPFFDGLDVRHARGQVPAGLGTLSFIKPSHVRRASALVREGLTVPLNLPIDVFDPPLFGRAVVRHELLHPNRNEVEDLLHDFNPQSSSQLDGLGHVRAREFGFFDGSTDVDAAVDAIGMQHFAERGIAGRAVLLDMTTIHENPFEVRSFSVDDVLGVARAQNVQIGEGDILIVHTGWAAAYLRDQNPENQASWAGLEGSTEMAEFLWDTGIALLGSDNPAIEPNPGDPKHGSLHRRSLPALGLSFLELLDLRQLVAAASARNRWDFFFVSVPLHLRGGVSSTANAMAIL